MEPNPLVVPEQAARPDPLSSVYRQRRRIRHPLLLAIVACALTLSTLVAAGCGGNSKPAYCSDRTNLQNSVKGLTSLNTSSGISGLQAQLSKVQSDATALVNSAKGDFPSETSAITSSVDALTSAVKALPSSPSAAQIASVATAAAGVNSAVKNFTNATNSQCS